MNNRVVALIACVLVCTSAPALAQETPAPAPTVPPSSAPASPNGFPAIPPQAGTIVTNLLKTLGGDAAAGYGLDPNHVRGSVTFFQRFDLQIRMPMNQYRNIHLHQGTEIDPRGATIAPGQVLDVKGHANADGTMEADIITIVH